MSDNVFNFLEKKQEAIEKKKRTFERIFFDEFLGTYTEIDANGTSFPVTMVDISRTGCQFQVPTSNKNSSQFQLDTEITLRFYFTKKSFIPVVVKVKHTKSHFENNKEFTRFGVEFDQSQKSFGPLKMFIEFVYQFAQYSVEDRGEQKVYFL